MTAESITAPCAGIGADQASGAQTSGIGTSDLELIVRHSMWRGARRVLLVRLDNLGDVLMCTPAMRLVRTALPQAHIALLTSPSGAALGPHLWVVDDVLSHSASWVKHPPGSRAGMDDQQALRALQAGLFDAAIIFTSATQSALPAAMLCSMAGIPLRLAHCRENPYDLLTDWVRDEDRVEPDMRHEVMRQLALLAAVGFAGNEGTRLTIRIHAADRERVRVELQACGWTAPSPYVVVHPGATASSRRYPPERFGQALDAIVAAGWTCIFCGTAGDRPLIDAARRAMTQPSLDLSGRLDVGMLAALLEKASLLVANNSGPAHLAAAVGTPVVCLYALTNPQHTPWGVPARVLSHEVPCRDCLRSICPQGHHQCLLGVKPQQVTDAALELLADGAHR